MATKVVCVTFQDGTQMYARYSTVTDSAEPDLQHLTCAERQAIESSGTPPPAVNVTIPSNIPEEIVQCEVRHYGEADAFISWTSTARRAGGFGTITGARAGEEYIGDTMREALKMNHTAAPVVAESAYSIWDKTRQLAGWRR